MTAHVLSNEHLFPCLYQFCYYYTQMMSTHTYMYKLYINTGIRNTDRQIFMYMYVLQLLASRMVFMYCSVDYLLQELY